MHKMIISRMPVLTSIPTTLDLALTGKTVKADKAKKLGIVDLLVSPLGPGKLYSCYILNTNIIKR